MSAQALIPPGYLALSFLSLGVQLWALAHLIGNGHNLIGTGLLRTSICRVACAVLYVYVGLNALWFTWAELYAPLVVFGLVQATWQANAVADVRLKRKLTRRTISSEEQPVTWLPGASVVDLSGSRGNGPFQQCLGVVLHVNDDENGTSDSFYETNPGQVTPNFQVYKDGSVHQYLPINWQPWCQVNGNFHYAAIETAGLPSEPLTGAQIAACGRILAAYHAELGVQLVTAEQPGQPGLGWHGMGGADWGGHTACPGDLRKAQRAQILQTAAGTPTPSPTPITTGEDDDMFVIFGYKGAIFVSPLGYAYKRGFKNMTALKQWEAAVRALGGKFISIDAMDPAQAASIPTGATIA